MEPKRKYFLSSYRLNKKKYFHSSLQKKKKNEKEKGEKIIISVAYPTKKQPG